MYLHFFHLHFVITVSLRYMEVRIVWSRPEFVSALMQKSHNTNTAVQLVTGHNLTLIILDDGTALYMVL